MANAIAEFLADLEQANRSAHTRRAYAADLRQFADWYHGPLDSITPAVLREFFAALVRLGEATRARKQAALASFLGWADRQELITANPTGRAERITLQPPEPRGVKREQVEAIPPAQQRDRLLFRLLFETGFRIGEALGLCVEVDPRCSRSAACCG